MNFFKCSHIQNFHHHLRFKDIINISFDTIGRLSVGSNWIMINSLKATAPTELGMKNQWFLNRKSHYVIQIFTPQESNVLIRWVILGFNIFNILIYPNGSELVSFMKLWYLDILTIDFPQKFKISGTISESIRIKVTRLFEF